LTYDRFGQVLTIKDALNRVVNFEYNGNGDVTKVVNEAGIMIFWGGLLGSRMGLLTRLASGMTLGDGLIMWFIPVLRERLALLMTLAVTV